MGEKLIPQLLNIQKNKNYKTMNIINPYIFVDIARRGLNCHLDASITSSYPGSGTTWTDLTGNGNNAIFYGGVTFDSVKGGRIITNGTTGYLNFGNIFNYTTEDFTFSFWIEKDISSSRTDNGPIVLYKGNAYGEGGYYLQFVTGGNGAMTFATGPVSTSYSTVGNYLNITIVKSGGNVNFFSNGIDITKTNPGNHSIVAISKNFTLAKYDTGYLYAGLKMFKFLNYNVALTSAEILQNYNAIKGRFQ